MRGKSCAERFKVTRDSTVKSFGLEGPAVSLVVRAGISLRLEERAQISQGGERGPRISKTVPELCQRVADLAVLAGRGAV
jgi:hypothetical protein